MNILIVDDKEINRKLLRVTLQAEGIDVFEASDGLLALEVLEKESIDLIISDILMPNMDGYKLCFEIRRNEKFNNIPIIIYTSTYTSGSDEKLATELGANRFIRKPASVKTLIDTIKEESAKEFQPQPQAQEPMEQLKVMSAYSDALVRKLEEKNDALEEVNRQLLKRTEQMEEQARLANLSAEISNALIQRDSLRNILNRCAAAMVRHFGAAFARIWTYNEAERMLELQASAGMYVHIDGRHSRIRLGEKKIGKIAKDRQPHLTDEIIGDPLIDNQEWAKSEGIVSFAGYPLIVADELVGVMAMFSRRLLSKSVQQAMASAANGIALGIERKRSEDQLLRQAALLDITPDAIMVRDLGNGIQYWNRGAEIIYGWTAEEIVGKSVREFFCENDLSQFYQARETLIEKGQWIGELRQNTKSGREIIVDSKWTLMEDEKGNPKSVLAVGTDVTERKNLEERFLRAQRMESIGTLAGGIAHDLNNVLTPILMSLQMLKNRLTDERSRQMIEMVESMTKNGASLIRQVLSFSRGLESERVIVLVRHLIREIERIAAETFPRSIQIVVDVPKDLWPILADATQLNQVLMNLLVNARDAMPNGGILTVSALNHFLDESYARTSLEAKAGPYVVVSVFDTGEGIPPQAINKIFDQFFTTKELGKGTGLGLSTVMTIVRGHGGFIIVNSEVGKGAEFKIYLPAMTSPETEKAGEEKFDLPAGNGESVLIVDDEASIREITKATLETYNYNVLTAGDGVEAVEQFVANRNDINIVLTDMMMPIMDGPTTIRALQRLNPQIKVIAVSGIAEYGELVAAAALGIAAFLHKPYTAEQLLRTLSDVLKR